MEFESRIQFLSVEEKKVQNGKLYMVKCFAGNEVVEFFVSGNNPFVSIFLEAVFADQIDCRFCVIPHPKFNGAFKLKFVGIA